MVGLHRTEPGPERSRLGFASTASAEFGFLLGQGFRLVELSDTLARYESAQRLVRVFHGRASYELGVEIGRMVEVDGVVAEQVFSLRDVIALERDPVEVGYGGTSASTRELVGKFLGQLGLWTREYAGLLLSDGEEAFIRLSERHTARFLAEQEELRASRLRALAGEAWRQRDFDTVINAYSEIESELSTVELKTSERGKLNYALHMVQSTRPS